MNQYGKNKIQKWSYRQESTDQNRLVPDQNRENIQILGPDQDHELFPNLWTSPGGLLIPAYQG